MPQKILRDHYESPAHRVPTSENTYYQGDRSVQPAAPLLKATTTGQNAIEWRLSVTPRVARISTRI
jgi:hypothetical protein